MINIGTDVHGAFKVVDNMEIACNCSRSSLFITTEVPKALHGSQTHQKKARPGHFQGKFWAF